MLKPANTVWFVLIALAALQTLSFAQPMLVPFSPINHPVSLPIEQRTQYRWNMGKGSWGESFVQGQMKRRGFKEIHEPKLPGGQGIDRIAIKRNAQGLIQEVKFLEAKTTNARPKLGQTKSGTQLSRNWLAKHIRAMSKSRDPAVRKLAMEIIAFRKQTNIPIEQWGELYHISTKTGKYTRYNPITKGVLSQNSIQRELIIIAKKIPSMKGWAMNTLANWDQISTQTMSGWLPQQPTHVSSKTVTKSILTTAKITNSAFRQLVKKAPIIVVVTVEGGFVAYDIYQYRKGKISTRQLQQNIITATAGTAGAIVGLKAGAAAGAWIGAPAGPWGVAIGGVIGGVVGGGAGYWGGSTISKSVTNQWYSSLDQALKEKVVNSIMERGFTLPL